MDTVPASPKQSGPGDISAGYFNDRSGGAILNLSTACVVEDPGHDNRNRSCMGQL